MWVDNNSSHKWTIREPGQLEKWTIREDLLYYSIVAWWDKLDFRFGISIEILL